MTRRWAVRPLGVRLTGRGEPLGPREQVGKGA